MFKSHNNEHSNRTVNVFCFWACRRGSRVPRRWGVMADVLACICMYMFREAECVCIYAFVRMHTCREVERMSVRVQRFASTHSLLAHSHVTPVSSVQCSDSNHTSHAHRGFFLQPLSVQSLVFSRCPATLQSQGVTATSLGGNLVRNAGGSCSAIAAHTEGSTRPRKKPRRR